MATEVSPPERYTAAVPPPEGPRRRPQRHNPSKPDRRQALISAMISLLRQRPSDDFSAADIATEAGVAHGLLFYYFGDKRGLYREALSQIAHELLEFQQPRFSEVTTDQRLEGLVRRHFEYLSMYRTAYASREAAPLQAYVDIFNAIFHETRSSGMALLAEILNLDFLDSPLGRAALQGWSGYLDELTDILFSDDSQNTEDLVKLAVAALHASVEQVRVATTALETR
jgi:AcrR family transcriptional regulator